MTHRLLIALSLFIALSAFADEGRTIRGVVKDASGAVVGGARVALTTSSDPSREAVTDGNGRFAFTDVRGTNATLVVTVGNVLLATVDIEDARTDVPVVVEAVPISDQITVRAAVPPARIVTTATKTPTPLRDVPQAVTVVSREVIQQQAMASMADVVRYVPGIGMASGEGNRDAPIFRGNSSTSDFFVDGIRDDAQYFRDLYNVDRVEALKGPNAMIFGRGGVGGVINRVMRKADFGTSRELTVQAGSWENRRISGDFGQAVSDSIAVRVAGMYEDSASYRDDATLERYGINPTMAFSLGPNTMLTTGYEFFHDERTADRGISSFAGRPVSTDASTFFGNADLSKADVTVNSLFALVEHTWSARVTLRNRIGFTSYDKFYQNVFPGAVDASGSNVSISAYNDEMDRNNVFNQTDLIMTAQTGRFAHTILAGMELGRQVSDKLRQTGFFTSIGPNVTSVMVPLTNPTTSLPMTFRPGASDAANDSVVRAAGIYVQDQMSVSEHVQVIAGLRYDNFQVDLRDHRNGNEFESRDGLVSPRVGLVLRPITPLSFYASYSLSYLPRAGEQLGSLSPSNQALEPEEFRNLEAGAKWDVTPSMAITTAVYQLDRGNVAVPHPTNPALSLLVDGQRTRGVEVDATGEINPWWQIIAAYAYQDGEITRSLSSSAQAGARLAQLPRHSIALWNKFDLSSRWGAGLGINHRTEVFTSTDNRVVMPGFTRVDAALYFSLTDRLGLQVNVENVFDTEYYAFAHSNTNITPGAPRALRVNWTTRF